MLVANLARKLNFSRPEPLHNMGYIALTFYLAKLINSGAILKAFLAA